MSKMLTPLQAAALRCNINSTSLVWT